MATKSKVESKVADINRLLNHTFTREELNEKLRRQGAFDEKKNVLNRLELERNLEFAKVNGNVEEAEKIEAELQKLATPALSWGTSLVKKEADKGLSEAERVHQINLRNQKLNIENGRRAQLEERKAAKKAAQAVARGEAAPNPFMRVRTVAKTHHDVNGTQSRCCRGRFCGQPERYPCEIRWQSRTKGNSGLSRHSKEAQEWLHD